MYQQIWITIDCVFVCIGITQPCLHLNRLAANICCLKTRCLFAKLLHLILFHNYWQHLKSYWYAAHRFKPLEKQAAPSPPLGPEPFAEGPGAGSLYIYIYAYIHTYIYICIYVYTDHIFAKYKHTGWMYIWGEWIFANWLTALRCIHVHTYGSTSRQSLQDSKADISEKLVFGIWRLTLSRYDIIFNI